jgi:hypothetical protein
MKNAMLNNTGIQAILDEIYVGAEAVRNHEFTLARKKEDVG